MFIGICTSTSFVEPKNDFFRSIKSYVYIFGMIVGLFIGSLSYVYLFFSDLGTTSNALICLMAACAGLGICIWWYTKYGLNK